MNSSAWRRRRAGLLNKATTMKEMKFRDELDGPEVQYVHYLLTYIRIFMSVTNINHFENRIKCLNPSLLYHFSTDKDSAANSMNVV